MSSRKSDNNYLPGADTGDVRPGLVNTASGHQNEYTPLIEGKVEKKFRESMWRWAMLFFACCFLFGSYFCYDNPGPIEETLEKDLKISTV